MEVPDPKVAHTPCSMNPDDGRLFGADDLFILLLVAIGLGVPITLRLAAALIRYLLA